MRRSQIDIFSPLHKPKPAQTSLYIIGLHLHLIKDRKDFYITMKANPEECRHPSGLDYDVLIHLIAGNEGAACILLLVPS